MSSVIDSIGSLFGSESEGSKAARHGMERQMNYQDEGLQYLQDTDAIPRELRENALTRLGGLYGARGETPSIDEIVRGVSIDSKYGPGHYDPDQLKTILSEIVDGTRGRDMSVDDIIDEMTAGKYHKVGRAFKASPSLRGVLEDALSGEFDARPGQGEIQQEMIDQAKDSPLYGAIMGGRKAGEEGILRHQGMTGGFRSGDTQENLYDYNVNLQNQALLQSYNQELMGLQGLSGLPSNANAIANQYNTMGSTYAQGRVGYQQAQAASQEEGMGYIMAAAQMGAGGFGGGTGGGGAAMGGGAGGAYGTQGIFGSGSFGKGF